jgi:ribonuclease J
MNLTIHRGTNEIGGSCVAISTSSTKILIDLGMPLSYEELSDEEKKEVHTQATTWSKGVSAIFISHYHKDHYGLLVDVPIEIPVYGSAGTKAMFEVNAQYSEKRQPVHHTLQVFPQGEVLIVGDINVTAYTVDHSAYDAYAFLIEAGGKSVLYSGDIRMHGIKGNLYRNLPQNVDCMILEGTNIFRDQKSATDSKSYLKFYELFERSNESLSLNLVWVSGQNIDRLVQIYKACRLSRKIMVVDFYLATCLAVINKINPNIMSPLTHSNIKVLYGTQNNQELAYQYKNKKVSFDEINNCPYRYVMLIRPSMLNVLRNNLKVQKANMITSIWKGYECRSMEFFKWIDEMKYDRHYIHTSGHADVSSLKTIVEHVKPSAIIPIHTSHKSDYQSVLSFKTMIVEDNDVIEL